MADHGGHIPVLLDETLEVLAPREGETALDCTAGLGGHSEAIARRLGPGGVIALADLDPKNLAAAATRLRAVENGPRVVEIAGNFARAPERLAEMGLRAGVILADLGFASVQVEDAARGFSFQREGPLDMRLDPSAPMSAADLVNTLPEGDLERVIREFGEERYARRVARKVVESRASGPISTTTELASIVRAAVPAGGGSRIDPATRTFQALRIAVNDEIGSLEAFLRAVERGARRIGETGSWLERGARLAVITFHSLEDRPVKQHFKGLVAEGLAHEITRKPLVAGDEERGRNPRARSAKLRAVRLAE